MSQYRLIFTNVGLTKKQNAELNNNYIQMTKFAVGSGVITNLNPSMTGLLIEEYRADINNIDTKNGTTIFDLIIPSDIGGFWIKEIALYDIDGDCICIGTVPITYKVNQDEGSSKAVHIKVSTTSTNTENIIFNTDDSLVYATVSYVNAKLEEKQDVIQDGGLPILKLDIDGATDIGANLVDTDLFVVDDGANGTNRKSAISRIWTYISGKLTGAISTVTTTNLTASKVLVSDASGKIAVSGVSNTTLGYLDATSSVQTQLNNKQATIQDGGLPILKLDIDGATDIGANLVDTDLFVVDDGANGTNRKSAISRIWTYISGKLTGAISTVTTTNLTASKVLISDASGKIAVSGVSNTTLGYLDATSSVQTQLNNKVNIADIKNDLVSIDTNKPLSAYQGKILKGYIDTINSLLLSDNTTLDSLQEIVDFIEMNRATLETLGISNIAGLQNALNAKQDVIQNGGLPILKLDIDGATDIGANLVDTDLIIVDDGANGTNRKSAISRIWTYISGKLTGAISTVLTSNLTASKVLISDASGKIAVSGVSSTEFVEKLVPPGTIISFASLNIPAGYLKCNGALISRTAYANLFAAIGTTYGIGDGSTTFALPDLRGIFLRGFDDAKGVDSGRIFGSFQDSANLSHYHTGSTEGAGQHAHTAANNTGGGYGADTQYMSDGDAITYNMPTSYDGWHGHNFSTSWSGETESRPKNIAMLYCIKY